MQQHSYLIAIIERKFMRNFIEFIKHSAIFSTVPTFCICMIIAIFEIMKYLQNGFLAYSISTYIAIPFVYYLIVFTAFSMWRLLFGRT